MILLIATTSTDKLREIRPLVAGLPVELRTLADVGPLPQPDETAATFWENAREKAFAYAKATGLTVVAEDSGLEIAGLDGEPGVQSARFLGTNVPYRERFAEIYRRLDRLPSAARQARFVTALAAVSGGRVLFETEAWIDGEIAPAPAGEHGFGYDPIFLYAPLGKTTAELTLDEKSAVSHRARAFRDFARWLRHAELS
ncbi:MAG TPA: non-canonical purine NTP pyrophosphatase [Vicinamibacterales bacterium]|nr:non-canonical purine NTP pyrophosphatase [Vicinamibacterales bacterium]